MMMILKELNPQPTKAAYRYDIFKGLTGPDGRTIKVRSIGSAYIREGQGTHIITLKTFLEDRFYLLPDTTPESPNNYVILTRELSRNLKKKYFWNIVGTGRIMDGPNHGLMKLTWDVLADDLYMSLHPMNVKGDLEVESIAA